MFESNPLDRIEQIDAMRLGVDYRMEIKVRGFTMMVRPLAISETLQVASTVQDELNKLPESARNRMTEHFILAKETLKIASTSDVGKNDWRITDLMMSKMTNDELHYLFKQYVAATDKVNPALEVLPPEEVQGIVNELKKNNSEADLASALTELSFSQLVSLARHYLTKDG
jgi:hypothetical protein